MSRDNYYRGWSDAEFGWSRRIERDRDYDAGYERGLEEAEREREAEAAHRRAREEEERLADEMWRAAEEAELNRQMEREYYREMQEAEREAEDTRIPPSHPASEPPSATGAPGAEAPAKSEDSSSPSVAGGGQG